MHINVGVIWEILENMSIEFQCHIVSELEIAKLWPAPSRWVLTSVTWGVNGFDINGELDMLWFGSYNKFSFIRILKSNFICFGSIILIRFTRTKNCFRFYRLVCWYFLKLEPEASVLSSFLLLFHFSFSFSFSLSLKESTLHCHRRDISTP